MASIHDLKDSVTEMSMNEVISIMQKSRANRREHVRNGGKSKSKKKKKKRKQSKRVKTKGKKKKDLQNKFKNMNSEQSKQMLEMLQEEIDNEE